MSSPPPPPPPATATSAPPPPKATAPGTESIQYIGRYLGLLDSASAVGRTSSSSSSSSTEASCGGGGKMAYIKKMGLGVGSMALRPLREWQLDDGGGEGVENADQGIIERPPPREIDMEERDEIILADRSSERVRTSSTSTTPAGEDRRGKEEGGEDDGNDDGEDDEEECKRLKREADAACKRVGCRYDALLRFVDNHPDGAYEEYVEYLLMGGGIAGVVDGGGSISSIMDEGYFRDLSEEDFYDDISECRKIWNDNLTLGLPASASTAMGRTFVPAAATSRAESARRGGGTSSSSVDDGRGFLGRYLRQRTLSEGERIKNHIAQVDRDRIKQGLGSAIGVISSVSSYALKPLRDLQLAEKLNALNIDMEEEEQRKEIAHHNRMMEERRDMEAMMRLRHEAEERCLNATTEHLLGFIRENPHAKYHQWIEDLHPENAHDGALLEGMGKTIDHRFFVAESDHRRIWNDNLLTFVDPDMSSGRDFVPARARQMDEYGESVVAVDILTGSVSGGERTPITPLDEDGKTNETSTDLLQFD